MAIQIKLKNSVVQDSTPSTSDLPAVGEIALNANINSIGGFMRASDNTIVKIFGPGSLSTPTATTTVSGISELATNSETTAGSATNRVVTPAGLNAVTVAERTTSNTNYVAKAGSTLTGVLTMPNGSNSAPAINFGDSDSGIFGGTNTVSLAAGGTTRLTADTGVDVTGTLTVNGAITSTSDLTIADKIIHAGDTDTAIRFAAANTISVENAGTESARFDSAGRLLIGTSTFIRVGASSLPKLQVCGTSENAAITLSRYTADNSPSRLSLGKARGATVGTMTAVQDDDGLGEIVFCGADGTDLHSKAASIVGEVDGTPGANDLPGRLEFRTTADGAAGPTTRLTIDSAGLVKIPDNGKFVAGAGSDLQISHDSSIGQNILQASVITRFRTNSLFSFQNSDGSEAILKGTPDAAVELFYNGSKKFETKSDGVIVTGNLNLSAEINLTDGSDANRFIDAGIGTNSLILRKTTGGDANHEEMAKFVGDSRVELMFDGTKKLETISSGAKVTDELHFSSNGSLIKENQIKFNPSGNAFIDHATVDQDIIFRTSDASALDTTALTIDASDAGTAIFNHDVKIPDNGKFVAGAGDDLQIYHDGSNSRILNTTGEMQNFADTWRVISNSGSNENMIRALYNGTVELYHDGSKRFHTTTSGAQLTGHLFMDDDNRIKLGNSQDLQIYHDGTDSYIDSSTGKLYIKTSNFVDIRSSGNETMIKATPNGAVELYYDNSKKFETTSGGVSITGDQTMTGNMFIGAELNLMSGSTNTNRFIDSSLGNGEALHVRSTQNGDANHENMATFTRNGASALFFDNAAKLTTTSSGVTVLGTVIETSDIALKSNIQPLTNTLEKLQQITGYKYNLINSISPSMGVIAQDVEKVFPELVHGSEGNKTLQYSGLIGVLVEAVKDLSAKVTALEAA